MTNRTDKVHVDGKFFRRGTERFYLKGLTYGPFQPNDNGESIPDLDQVQLDFQRIRGLGANVVRIYTVPAGSVLDLAVEHDLRVFVDIPWEKHRCFFEDWGAIDQARNQVRQVAEDLGSHPGLFAVSVVNEIPNDVVRFYGHQRVEILLSEFADIVKQASPECLTTFANYPTTEFLHPSGFDFCCFNVYLENLSKLGAYLDRLQHIAGDGPLVLGEFGIDSLKHGEPLQAQLLADHINTVFRHGVAGSIIFSFTDDWFTGGARVTDWHFGVTEADRIEKPAATAIRDAWQRIPFGRFSNAPRVSVVVCSYNGAKTLRRCLESLRSVNYPDYEVILVDDGSEDDTPAIAESYSEIKYIRQTNHGLSVARNVGLEASTGTIVAYTDSDCVVDQGWLRGLTQAMADQQVDAIGGPNITPHEDGWSAQCVAVSPGNPSHVMLDDQRAEHIPGCNMAYYRDALVQCGGFDAMFRQAGDDVDLCWRLMDAGFTIGYAPGAFVWHHRRETVRAYLKQQVGYGRAEALLHFKHPHRFGFGGRCTWHGRIYGGGTAGLPLIPERIYYGPSGVAPFQVVYRHNHFGIWACVTWLEWHLLAAFFAALGFLFWPMFVIAAVMWTATVTVAIRASLKASLPSDAPWWCRPLVVGLHVAQPVVREWYRLTYDLRLWRPRLSGHYLRTAHQNKQITPRIVDLYWESLDGPGRLELLQRMEAEARHHSWLGVFDNAWAAWDAKLVGDLWHCLYVHTATEEIGDGRRFTRARCIARPTLVNYLFSMAALLWSVAAIIGVSRAALIVALLTAGFAYLQNRSSRVRCLEALVSLVARSGELAGLSAVTSEPTVFDNGSTKVGSRRWWPIRTRQVESSVPSS